MKYLCRFVLSKEYVVGLMSGCVLSILLMSYPENHLSNLQQETEVVPARRDRILCWIVTAPQNKFKAEMVKNTWGRRCDKLLFISSQNDTSLPTIGFPISGAESREQLWIKANATFYYVYDKYLDDYDWFFKADDDTYVIMENLRDYLSSLDPLKAHFLGRRFHEFLSGGSGYVFSRETLRILVEEGLNKDACNATIRGSADDLILGLCLTKLGIEMADTRDERGHQRFVPFQVEDFYSNQGATMNFIHGNEGDFYPTEHGYNCCSTRAISFHYTAGYRMQMYEYLIYQLNVANRPQP